LENLARLSAQMRSIKHQIMETLSYGGELYDLNTEHLTAARMMTNEQDEKTDQHGPYIHKGIRMLFPRLDFTQESQADYKRI